jgi:hypothetical protein
MNVGDFKMDHLVDVGDAPAVLRASTYVWLASALVSGVIPAIVMAMRQQEN